MGLRTGSSKALAAAAVAGSIALLGAQAASGAASGSWTATGSLNAARYWVAAAPLANGQVLIAGGANTAGDAINTAELYNPGTGAFANTTGNMNSTRSETAGAPLLDGRALVAGGFDAGTNPLATAETFNPATGTFTNTTGNMGTPRRSPAAAPLPDGRVLVMGGTADAMSSLKSTEIFNPASGANGTFSAGPDMTTERQEAAAVPLPDGRILVAGGFKIGTGLLQSAEVYNPATNTFTAVGSMLGTVRRQAGGSPLPDGRALIAGGASDLATGVPLASAEVFDPVTNTFSSTGIGSMAAARIGPGVAPLRDGRVLAGAGRGSTAANALTSAELFTLAPPSKALKFAVQGTNLVLTVEVPGTVSVTSDTTVAVKAGSGAIAARKKKKKKRKKAKLQPVLNPSSATGSPTTITVPLSLTSAGQKQIQKAGKVSFSANIVFTPRGDECLKRFFAACYSSQYATTETQTLTVSGQKKKCKKGRKLRGGKCVKKKKKK